MCFGAGIPPFTFPSEEVCPTPERTELGVAVVDISHEDGPGGISMPPINNGAIIDGDDVAIDTALALAVSICHAVPHPSRETISPLSHFAHHASFHVLLRSHIR